MQYLLDCSVFVTAPVMQYSQTSWQLPPILQFADCAHVTCSCNCRGSPRNFSRRADESQSWVSTKPPAGQPPAATAAPTGPARKPHPSEGRWGKQEAPAQTASTDAANKPTARTPEKTDNMYVSRIY